MTARNDDAVRYAQPGWAEMYGMTTSEAVVVALVLRERGLSNNNPSFVARALADVRGLYGKKDEAGPAQQQSSVGAGTFTGPWRPAGDVARDVVDKVIAGSGLRPPPRPLSEYERILAIQALGALVVTLSPTNASYHDEYRLAAVKLVLAELQKLCGTDRA